MGRLSIGLVGLTSIIAATVTLTALSVPDGEAQAASYKTYAAGQCRATDGDTLSCGRCQLTGTKRAACKQEKIRLVEIDAPEMPGHCRVGRDCATGDPYAAKDALAEMIKQGVSIKRFGTDRYSRTIADARVGDVSVSCALVRAKLVTRQLKWADYGVTKGCDS